MSANDYSRGLAKANKGIELLQRIFDKKLRKVAEMNHDKADRMMYQALAKNDENTADFNRGQAMGYGMYAHTGTKLNK